MTSNSEVVEAAGLQGEADVVHKVEDVFVGVDEPEDAGPVVDECDDIFGEARGDDGDGPVEESKDELEGQDCAPRRVAPDPGLPTQSEIDEHNVDHWPYRSWCEHCVRGRAVGEPHRSGPESTVPAFDYLFIAR